MTESTSGGIIGVSIEVIFIATIGTVATGLLVNANYTNWSDIQTMMFKTVMVIVIAVSSLIIVLNRAGHKIDI